MKKEFTVGNKVIIEAEVVSIQQNTIGIRLADRTGIDYHSKSYVKHIEPEFIPRRMLCWIDIEECASDELVIGMFDGKYLTKTANGNIYGYKNAKDLPKQLENGNVYKNSIGSIVYKTGEKSCFGFNAVGKYVVSDDCFIDKNDWQPYGIEDFKILLIAEAKKRGFKSDIWIECKELVTYKRFTYKYIDDDNFSWYNGNTDMNLLLNGQCIFKNGIWAKIID